MGQVVYAGYFDDIVAGEAGVADLRLMLCMSDTTCDTENDASNMSDFTTIDECDGAGYVQLDLANVAAAYDAANDRLEYDADDGDLDGGTGIITASTRTVTFFVVKRYVDGTDANDVPWFGRDIGPYTLAGGAFDFTFHAEGILQAAGA